MTSRMTQASSHIVSNSAPRVELFEGAEYLVYPAVALTEGVHNRLFYPGAEVEKFPSAWNGRPVPVLHPEDAAGNPISANSPPVLESRSIGFCFNFHGRNGLRGELWINKAKAIAMDPDLIAKMNEQMEVSTCLWLDGDGVPGEWKGEPFEETVFNYRPDHIAILPGTVGACSWEDGCGVRANRKGGTMDQLLRLAAEVENESRRTFFKENGLLGSMQSLEASMEEVQTQLRSFVDGLDYQEGERMVWHFLEAVYDSYFVYSRMPTNQDRKVRFYRHSYTLDTNETVNVTDEPVEVRRKVSFEELTTTAVNTQKEDLKMGNKEKKPCCPDRVAALIANQRTAFTTDDAEYLNTLSEERLGALERMQLPVESKEEPEPAPTAANSADTTPPPAPKAMTVNEYIEQAPPEIGAVLRRGIDIDRRHRGALIQRILSVNSEAFTKEQLEAKNADELEALEKLAGSRKPKEDDLSMPIYPGRGIGVPTALSAEDDDEPLAPVGNMTEVPKSDG